MANIPFTNNYQDLSSAARLPVQVLLREVRQRLHVHLRGEQARHRRGGRRRRRRPCSAGSSAAPPRRPINCRRWRPAPSTTAALDAAVQEISPLFKQCTRCGNWVCEPVCWNKKAGLCEACAPDLDEEIASAQAQAARDQAMEKARSVNYLGERDLAQVAAAVCPKCGAKTQGGKFCPECGASVAAKRKCGHCGAQADGTPKFCPECGEPYDA